MIATSKTETRAPSIIDSKNEMTTDTSNNNYSNINYSPKPFVVSKERFRSASSATAPPSLHSFNNTNTSSNQSNNYSNQQETFHSPPTIKDLNLPTVRKSRRKKPTTHQDESQQLTEEEQRRLMMLKRKSRFIFSSSLSNSRPNNIYNDIAADDDENGSHPFSIYDDGSGGHVGGINGDGNHFEDTNYFDQTMEKGQLDLETQFNNFLKAQHNKTENNNTLMMNNNNRHSSFDIPRVLMEHFQKEEIEWNQQVRQLTPTPSKQTSQMSTFTLNNSYGSTNSASSPPDLFRPESSVEQTTTTTINNNKLHAYNHVKNNKSVSPEKKNQRIFDSEQKEGVEYREQREQQEQVVDHYQYYNNYTFSSSFGGRNNSYLINNNQSMEQKYTPFSKAANYTYTTHSMMNENEYLQANSSTTDYSYPIFHTDDETSMFDDQPTTDSTFEKLILDDDDELLDYGDCDVYGEIEDDSMDVVGIGAGGIGDNSTSEDDESFIHQQTPPTMRPVYLSLQTLPMSPLMSASNESHHQTQSAITTAIRKSSVANTSSPSSVHSPVLNNNNDEVDIFGNNVEINSSMNENARASSGSPIDVNRKSRSRRSVPSEEFNKFLLVSSPSQQQIFQQGACSPARAMSPSTVSALGSSPGRVSHHSRKMSSGSGVGGHVRRNSGLKKQPRTNSYTVSSILGDSQLKELFFDFLKEHHNSELVLFLQEEEEFRLECQTCIAPNIGMLLVEYEIKMDRIKQIFETYIKPGSNSELNLSNETRLKVENRVSILLIPPVIFRHKGIGDLHLSRWISPDTFESVTTEVKISLKNHILPLFLESPRFENYLVQKHIQENTVSNLRGKKIQRMLGCYIPESAKDSFYVDGATVAGISKPQHHFSTINDPTSKKSRPKKSLATLFGNHSTPPAQTLNSPNVEQQFHSDTSPKSPFKNEQHKNQSLSKFKNWIMGKKSNPNEPPNPSSSWSTLSKKSQLTVNNASNSAPQLVGTSTHIKISPREMESDKKVAHNFVPLTMNSGHANTFAPEINSLINDGILFIKVHTKKRGNCKILEINIDKMSMLSDQDKNLAKQLKNVLLTHTDADVNPFDKYPHLRDFLQTKISVQSQKNWEEINADCIIKVKSPPTSHFFKL